MKKYLIVLLSLLAILSCTACSSKESEQEPKNVVIEMPAKGDSIKLGDNEFLVLKTAGTNAFVISKEDFETQSGFENNVYEDSETDRICTIYYELFSDDVKDAIVDKEIDINSYSPDWENYDVTAFDYSTKIKSGKITRKVFIPDLEDIQEYFNGEYSNKDIQNFFSSDTSLLWLRSQVNDDSEGIWGVNCQSGTIMIYSILNQMSVRPEFEIDLSKVAFEIVK